MKDLIHNVELALQELSLRSIEMVERAPIQNLLIQMYAALDNMQAGPGRAVLRAFVEKLEGALA